VSGARARLIARPSATASQRRNPSITFGGCVPDHGIAAKIASTVAAETRRGGWAAGIVGRLSPQFLELPLRGYRFALWHPVASR
jgi:hypothetical protein